MLRGQVEAGSAERRHTHNAGCKRVREADPQIVTPRSLVAASPPKPVNQASPLYLQGQCQVRWQRERIRGCPRPQASRRPALKCSAKQGHTTMPGTLAAGWWRLASAASMPSARQAGLVVLHWGGRARLVPLASHQLQFMSLQTQLDAHSKAMRVVCRQLACWWPSAAPGAVPCLVMHTCRRSIVALSEANRSVAVALGCGDRTLLSLLDLVSFSALWYAVTS